MAAREQLVERPHRRCTLAAGAHPLDAARATMLARVPEGYFDMLPGQWEEETHRPATVTGEVKRITGAPATPCDDALAWGLACSEAGRGKSGGGVLPLAG